jgi:hypothetical protein
MAALPKQATGFAVVALTAAFLAACAGPSPDAPPVASKSPIPATPATAIVVTHIPSLQDLTGLRQPDILAMLGTPDLKRLEPPAELWQYRAADCVLTLFFYREQGGYRLARAEAWQRSFAGSSTQAQCHDGSAPVRAHLVSLQSSL